MLYFIFNVFMTIGVGPRVWLSGLNCLYSARLKEAKVGQRLSSFDPIHTRFAI